MSVNENFRLFPELQATREVDEFHVPVEPWMDDALCAQVSPVFFFPTKGREGQALAVQGKRVCGWCTVREDCLLYALEHDEDEGIWGGVGSVARRKLKRELEDKRRDAA